MDRAKIDVRGLTSTISAPRPTMDSKRLQTLAAPAAEALGQFQEATGKRQLILALASMACLLPFINKAFHVDDPLFLWSAKQIQAHPLDPFGFDVNWDMTPVKMVKETKNPPLACYYLALAAALFGWSEPALHLAYLLPALAAVLGTFRLARQFCSRPALAALVMLATPAFLVSSTTLMCDTMMLAFWIWALVFWEEGITTRRAGLLFLAGLLIGLGCLTKYFAISLVPLLGVYTAVRVRRPGAWFIALFIPIGIMVAYLLFIQHQYRLDLAREVIGFSTDFKKDTEKLLKMYSEAKLLTALAFTGGCLAPVLFFVPVLWRWRAILIFLLIPLIVMVLLFRSEGSQVIVKQLAVDDLRRMYLIFEFSLFCMCGSILIGLAAADLWQRRDAKSFLLCLWIGGTFFFAGFVNWAVNARSILPMAPAAGILIARRLDTVAGKARDTRIPWRFALPLLPAFLLAFWVAWSDYTLANAGRTAARVLRAYAAKHPDQRMRFAAHWGFQYYMQEYGFGTVDGANNLAFEKGDILAVGSNNYKPPYMDVLRGVQALAQLDVPESVADGNWSYALHWHRDKRTKAYTQFRTLDIRQPTWLSTIQPAVGAGFYSHYLGPLPFSFAKVPEERYVLLHFERPIKFVGFILR